MPALLLKSAPALAAGLLAALLASACAPADAEKAPFKLLYNNDTTNMESCQGPFHAKGAKFTPEVLDATIDEAVKAGADAYMFAPGLTYVPLWNSQTYPPKAHFEWFRKTFPNAPETGFGDYLLSGGDMVADYVAHCRKAGIAPFISLRLNDYHLVEFLDVPEGDAPPAVSELTLDRFRRGHPQWRLKPDPDSPYKRINPKRDYNVMNFAVPQVRERMLSFVEEIAAYDIDGLEIDFLRHFRLFNLDETSAAQRREIVADFMGQARRILDRHARPGQRRWLAVRIPSYAVAHDPLGIDIAAFARAGVDMFNISSNYYTLQQEADYAALRAQAPDKAFYWEMTHVSVVGPDPKKAHGDSTNYRRTTDEQFYTTAHLAYRAGYDGMSLFNFQYYRDYESRADASKGPFHEPPFHILKGIKDPSFVAKQPQYYFIAPVWQTPYGNMPTLPAPLKESSKPVVLTFRAAAPEGGWQKDGTARIQADRPFAGGTQFTATLNGQALPPKSDTAEPYPSPYPQMLGNPETLRAWTVPAGLLKDGDNTLSITVSQPDEARIIFAEITMP